MVDPRPRIVYPPCGRSVWFYVLSGGMGSVGKHPYAQLWGGWRGSERERDRGTPGGSSVAIALERVKIEGHQHRRHSRHTKHCSHPVHAGDPSGSPGRVLGSPSENVGARRVSMALVALGRGISLRTIGGGNGEAACAGGTDVR